MAGNRARAYWRQNLIYLALLLTVWFAVSFGAGILFVDELDKFRLGGFKLGFWFAQQGSIFTFVAIIFTYVWLMARLDRKYAAQLASGDASTEDDVTEGQR